MATKLSGIETAEDVLGLSLKEIADAVRINPSTLYRWRKGDRPIPASASLERLDRLEELSLEVRGSLERAQVEPWLDSPVSVFGGSSPREMILSGRVETVLGALLSHRQFFGALRAAGRGDSRFSDLMKREDLSLSAKATLALIDREIDELVADMQTDESRKGIREAFDRPPRVKIALPQSPDDRARGE